MKSTQELRDAINDIPVVADEKTILKILNVLDDIVATMEQRDAANRRAANVASCLANGILPD